MPEDPQKAVRELAVPRRLRERSKTAEGREMATQNQAPKFDTVGFLVAYENGELDFDEVVEGFQALVDNGTVWHLQGHYQRTAVAMLAAGHLQSKGRTY
jgi:hypothetical protein